MSCCFLSDLQGISKISPKLEECINLVHLNLSRNSITRIENVGKLMFLKTLFLSCNNISSLEGLEDLPSLVELHVEGNQIARIDEIQRLLSLPALRALYLRTLSGDLTNPSMFSVTGVRIVCVYVCVLYATSHGTVRYNSLLATAVPLKRTGAVARFNQLGQRACANTERGTP